MSATRETAFDHVLHALDQAGRKYKHDKPNHVQASCPGPIHKHGDRNPSLSITAIESQVLMHCQSGDPIEVILDALGLTQSDLFNDKRGAQYRYDDGRIVTRSPDKKFRQSGNTDGQHSRLFREARIRQAILEGHLVFFPEGEKDVEAIEAEGGIATTNPMGASNVHLCDLTPLYGGRVTVLVDRDPAGEGRARFLRQALTPHADVDFAQAKVGKDAADHIAAGFGLDQFEPYQFPISRLLQGGRTAAWLDQQVFEPLEWIVPGLIPEGYALLVGAPKIGKSWLSLAIALAVSSGGHMFGKIYCGRPRPVLLLALEDSHRRMQSRMRKLTPDEPKPELLTYFTDLSPSDVIPTIEEWLIGVPRSEKPLVILDTIGKVIPPAATGESPYQRDNRFSSQLQTITKRRPGMALMGLHHDRKATTDDFVESISGTNGIAGAADTLLVIQRPRNEPEGLLSITGRDVEEERYGVKLTEGQWSIIGDNLKQAAKAARTVKATVGVDERMADVIEFVNDHPAPGVKAADVTKEFPDIDEDQAGVYLRRAVSAGRIRKVKRGLFAPIGPFEVFGVFGNDDENQENQTLQTHQTGGMASGYSRVTDDQPLIDAWGNPIPENWQPSPDDDFDDQDESIDHETAEATLAAIFSPEPAKVIIGTCPICGKSYREPPGNEACVRRTIENARAHIGEPWHGLCPLCGGEVDCPPKGEDCAAIHYDPIDGKSYDDPVPEWILNPELIEIEWHLSHSGQLATGEKVEIRVAKQPDRITSLCLAGAEGHELCSGRAWYGGEIDTDAMSDDDLRKCFGPCLCDCHRPISGRN